MIDASTDESSVDVPNQQPGDADADADAAGSAVQDLLDERLVVVVSVALFATPAAITALHPYADFPSWVVRTSPFFIIAAVSLYWHLTDRDESARTDAQGEPLPEVDRANRRPERVDVNYEILSEQAMYRDQLLIRANYFSVAVVAVLVNIFLRTSPDFRPAVAMIGATTAYAFWLATASYRGTRDELNDELRRLEAVHPDFTVVETYDTRERSAVGTRSLSSYFVGFQIATTALWGLVYLGYVVYLNL